MDGTSEHTSIQYYDDFSRPVHVNQTLMSHFTMRIKSVGMHFD